MMDVAAAPSAPARPGAGIGVGNSTQFATALGAGGGYSRRALPGDPKTTDRRRLLADRNAYIAYLEAQAELRVETERDVADMSTGLRHVCERVQEIEEKTR